VKIKLIHRVCGREVLIQQVVDNQGHCPWDGRPFNKDYTANLTDALRTAEVAGGVLENALETIAGIDPDFVLDEDSLLEPLRTNIRQLALERKPATR
jgi:hypothetical protein